MIILLSGGFDPVHIGHLRMFQAAKAYADDVRVVVALNSDEWLVRKKGKEFMSFEERKEILEGFSAVDEVIAFDDSDNTAIGAIDLVDPDYFANGGDRIGTNTPEVRFCNEHGIGLLWNVGGGKIQSSSDLIKGSQKEPS